MQAMTLRLPDEVHDALRREAYESRRSMNQIILDALTSQAAVTDEYVKYVRRAQFEAWDEGKFAERRAAAEKTFPVNPYREGSK